MVLVWKEHERWLRAQREEYENATAVHQRLLQEGERMHKELNVWKWGR